MVTDVRPECVNLSTSEKIWDAFVSTNQHGYHEHTSMYGQIRSSYGFACERVFVRKDGQIVGGAQVLSQLTPVGTFARVLAGPLAENDDHEIFFKIAMELDRLAKKKSYLSMRIDTLPSQHAARLVLYNAGFRNSNGWFEEKPSLVALLDCSDDEMLERFGKKTRKCIRAAQRKEVLVSRYGKEGLSDFYHLYLMTQKHQGSQPFPKDYLDYLLRLFGKINRFGLFIAYYKGAPVAGKTNMIAGGQSYASWVGMHRGAEQKKLRANELLHFTIMRWARDQGCKLYDLGGVAEQKRKVARDIVYWPQPMRKFYGPFRRFYQSGIEWSWDLPWIRRKVNCVAWRLGLRPRMPW